MAESIVIGGILGEVQTGLRSVFNLVQSAKDQEKSFYATNPIAFANDQIALAKEIRKYEAALDNQQPSAGLTSALTASSPLNEIESTLLMSFKEAVASRKDVSIIVALASEIRKYEHDINKQNKKKNAATQGPRFRDPGDL